MKDFFRRDIPVAAGLMYARANPMKYLGTTDKNLGCVVPVYVTIGLLIVCMILALIWH